jgi:restriction endonuclease S subunit
MKQGWEIGKLRDVLKQYRITVWVDDTKLYNQLTNSKHSGIKARGYKIGNEIGRKRQFRVDLIQYPNTILYTRQTIQEDEAIGLCPPEVDGCIVTENMPLFSVVGADPHFVELYFKSEIFLKQLNLTAAIGTSQQSILEDTFLGYEIPLPPLAEQQRIAGRLAALKGKIDAVRRLREEQGKIKSAFRNGLFKKICRNFRLVALHNILVPRKEIVAVAPQMEYNQITVKMQHKGVILRGTVMGAEVGSVQLRAKEGDFIISKIDARNGAMGIVPKSLDNAIVTNDFPLFSFSSDCLPKYFEFVSNTDYFDQNCIQSSEGTTNRVRLKMDRFANIEIPIPPLSEQKRVVEILEKIDALQEIQAGQLSALEGLFPGVLEQAFRGEW